MISGRGEKMELGVVGVSGRTHLLGHLVRPRYEFQPPCSSSTKISVQLYVSTCYVVYEFADSISSSVLM